jgi:uncharacterized protein YbjT (DUF2867 family)
MNVAAASGGQRPRVLLTGATGFVGGALWPVLLGAGYPVRGLTRHLDESRRRAPQREWAEADLETGSPDDLARLLDGCGVAFYLVHGMAAGASDFRRREVEQATRFARAAARAGVERLVYLGGVAPAGPPSEHLLSRLEVGEALRSGATPAIELRASMIIGAGSVSWIIVRDLAARLPAMVLPRWLRSRTEPVAIDDVVAALVAAIDLPQEGSADFDLPGPACLTAREILEATAVQLGLRPPLVVEVPLLTPWLSSHWVRLVTRANWAVARELVLGLEHDLLARDGAYWERIGHRERVGFVEATRRAIAADVAGRRPAAPGARRPAAQGAQGAQGAPGGGDAPTG